jgi:endonuclease/exonuclease/phosphatase (EEP) superfamily protein YafD
MPQADVPESRVRRWLFPSWASRKRLLLRETWLFVLASYPIIALAYLWPADFRNTQPAFVMAAWSAFMVRTLLFHAGIVYLLIVLAAGWKRKRRLLLASCPLALVALGPTVAEYRPRKPPPVSGEVVSVMNVNLLMANQDTAGIISEIRSVSPELLLLQEYTEHWHAALQTAIGGEYPHIAYTTRDDSFGMAIYSRRPFVEPVKMRLPLGAGDLPQMRAVIAIAGRPTAVYNVHPLPPTGLAYVTESRLQIADLADLLRSEQLPAIISGDFNFTENSPQFDLLTSLGFVETHRLAGWGREATWPVNSIFRWMPGFRLDRILLSSTLTATESRTGVGMSSDHRPVIARIGMRR